jgi:hypothetical protein
VADDPDATDQVASLPAALAYSLAGNQGVKNSALADKYLTERRGRAAKYAADYEDVMSQRQAEVENAKRILDSAAEAMRAGHTGAGPGQMNLPMLQMAAGFFKPTKTGNFGEELSNGLTGLGAGVAHQRMSNVEFEKGMADLATKRSTLVQEPLKDRAALLKAQQLADEQGVRALEVAQVRTANGAGAGSTPAKMKMFEEWAKSNPGKSFTDFLMWESKLGSDKNSPASLREYEAAKQSNPDLKDMTYEQWLALKARSAASGKAIGEDVGKVTQSLPKFEAVVTEGKETINTLLNDKEGMANAVGKMWANAPALWSTPKARWEANYNKLMGEVFGAVYEELRGAGQITEMESLSKIKGAVASSRTQSPEDFAKALRRYERQLEISRNILREKVGKPQSTVGPPAANTQQAPTQQAPAPQGPWSRFGGGG